MSLQHKVPFQVSSGRKEDAPVKASCSFFRNTHRCFDLTALRTLHFGLSLLVWAKGKHTFLSFYTMSHMSHAP